MSDTAKTRRKVSREGLDLIKSLQGFRPAAARDADDRWSIGYGHIASARQGQTIGETEADLLLQYDLLPIVQALNTLDLPLNARQFDALASFGLSMGLERFLESASLAQMSAGAAPQAADAMLSTPAPVDPDAGLRRRAIERAWFSSDPEHAVSLQRLMTAPIPASSERSVEAPAPAPAPVGPGLVSHEEVGLDRFDWREAGTYVVTGVIGLVACAFSAVAFRLSSMNAASSEDSLVIGWVLAVTGVTCVVFAAWNLYLQTRD